MLGDCERSHGWITYTAGKRSEFVADCNEIDILVFVTNLFKVIKATAMFCRWNSLCYRVRTCNASSTSPLRKHDMFAMHLLRVRPAPQPLAYP